MKNKVGAIHIQDAQTYDKSPRDITHIQQLQVESNLKNRCNAVRSTHHLLSNDGKRSKVAVQTGRTPEKNRLIYNYRISHFDPVL